MTPPRLRHAFAHTHYRVRSPAGPLLLHIGRRSPALAQWARARNPLGNVLVTAWNPQGRRQSLSANRAAQRRLQQRLRAWQLACWPSVAQDPKGLWPDEPGMLIFGVPEALALELGRALGQRAVVFIKSDAVPRLLWV